MKKLSLLLAILTPILLVGQEVEKERSKFSIGLNISPNYSYRTLSYDEEGREIVEFREEYEDPGFGFNTGVAVQYVMNERVELALNAQVSRQTHIFKDLLVTDVIGSQVGRLNWYYSYYYLEVPARVNYHFLKGDFFGYVTAGASVNFLLKDEIRTEINFDNGESDERTTETSIQNFKETTIGLIGGFGFGYHLNEKWDARMEPVFRYSLTPLAEAPIDQFNYSIGYQIGVNMRL